MKKIVLGIVAGLLMISMAACGNGKNAKSKREMEAGHLVLNGDFVVPPTAHGNPFIGGYIGGGVEPYLQDTLFAFTPLGDEHFKPHLAESYDVEDNKITVTLKDNLKWSDGTPLTAEDVLTSYQMWVGKKQIWEFLDEIEVPDDQTLVFNFKNNSGLMMNLLSDVRIEAPKKEYDDYAKKYADIAKNGREWHDETNSFWFSEEANEQLQKLNDELEAHKPAITDSVGSGAFVVDNLSTGEAVLKANKHFYNDTGLEGMKIVRAITPEVAANSMVDGTLDIHSGGMTEDLIKQVKSKIDGYQEFYLPEYSQMSVVFNVKKPFAENKAFREALAYLINREEILPLAEVGSMESEQSSTGLPLSLQKVYEVQDWSEKELEQRKYDVEKAEKILLDAKWKKDSDGKWLDEKGQKVKFDFACNNGWGSALLPGEAIVNELNNFGFDVTFRPMEGAAYDSYLRNGEHTVAIEFAPPSNILYANPYGTYEQLYKGRAWLFGLEASPEGELILKDKDGKDVDVIGLTNSLFDSTGDDFTDNTKKLMEITNANVLFIPYLEKGFPVRILKDNIDLQVKDGELIQDPRFVGVGETMFSSLISEGALKDSIKPTEK